MKHRIPRRILKQAGGVTARQWKQQKRHEARVLARTFDNFAFGSAFTPAQNVVNQFYPLLKKLRESLKVSNWGN
jgi:hypothetical protein